MRHVVVATPPAPGHVYPTLGLIEELIRRGDRVTMITGPTLAATVRATGATVVELDWEPDTSGLADREFTVEVLLADMLGYLQAAQRLLPTLLERLSADPPAVVCSDSVLLGPLLAGRYAVPAVSLLANFATNEHVRPDRLIAGFDPSHPGLVDHGRRVGELFARLDVAAPDPRRAAELTLVFLPREFQIAAETFDDSVRFVGPSPARCREEVWTPRGEGRVLLVSMGTAFTRRPQVFRVVAQAFADTDWQVVMAVGEHVEHDAFGALPPNIEIASRLPQPAVLSRAHAFVSHAGMGSVMEALLHEVPVVAVPHAAEQHLNAERLAELGLGRHLEDTTPALVRAAVEQVATDPAVRHHLATMRQSISNAGGAASAADAIDDLLSGGSSTRPGCRARGAGPRR